MTKTYMYVNSEFNDKIHEQGRTLLRVAREMRGFLANAPKDDPDVRSLLRDCDVLDEVGKWLATTSELVLSPDLTINAK